jgi:AcrR family transcriptional regulator
MATQSQTIRPPANGKKSRRRCEPSAAHRLKMAFAALTARVSPSDDHQKVTAAELCRMAGVSRNSLYRYHTDLVSTLRRYQREHPAARTTTRSRPEPGNGEITDLREQLAKLATRWSTTITAPIVRHTLFCSAGSASSPTCAAVSIQNRWSLYANDVDGRIGVASFRTANSSRLR